MLFGGKDVGVLLNLDYALEMLLQPETTVKTDTMLYFLVQP